MSLHLIDAPRPAAAPVPRALRPLPGIARDITYAGSAQTRPGRAFIRAMENATGRLGLLRRAAGYEAEAEAGHDFWRLMVDRFGLRLDVVAGALDHIPRTGPLVVVANHPYGVLDGLVLGHILSGLRGGDFRILAHQVFRKARALDEVILPIDFSGTRAAMEVNLTTRATAIAHLRAGGAIGIFPGGTVSTAASPFGRPMDPVWRGFSARMIRASGATVVPIWFDGANSRLFQVASHLNYTLRMALLLHEFRRRTDRPVRLAIGAPIGPEALAAARDGKEMMDFLRRTTYALSPEPLDPGHLGHEFEEQYRR
jgi:putative hemolysin